MKKIFILLLLLCLNFPIGLFTNAENTNVSSYANYEYNLSDENIRELLKNLNLQSLKGEDKRDAIYSLLKSTPQLFSIFEPVTNNAEKISDILGKYSLSNYTNDFYIVLNKILKEKTIDRQNKINMAALAG